MKGRLDGIALRPGCDWSACASSESRSSNVLAHTPGFCAPSHHENTHELSRKPLQWLPKENENQDNKLSQKPRTQARASSTAHTPPALGRQHGRMHDSIYAVHEKTRAEADAKVRRSCFQFFGRNSASTPARVCLVTWPCHEILDNLLNHLLNFKNHLLSLKNHLPKHLLDHLLSLLNHLL